MISLHICSLRQLVGSIPGRGIVSKTMVIIVRGDVEFIPFQIGDEASEEP